MKLQKRNLSDFQYVELGYVFSSSNGYSGFSRNKYVHISEIAKFRKEKKDTGIYRSAFLYDSLNPMEEDKPYLFSDFYLDFDKEGDLEQAREDALFCIWRMSLKTSFNLPNEAFHIYFSGQKGFHVMIPWQYFGYGPNQNLDYYFKILAKDLFEFSPNKTVDLKVYEKRRLFRLENSIHPSTGYRKVPLTYSQLSKLSMDEIYALAKTNYLIDYPKPKLVLEANREFKGVIKIHEEKLSKRFDKDGSYKRTMDFTPHCVEMLIENGPVSGQRNETVAVLTSFFRNQGHTEDEIYEKLKLWNNGSLKDIEITTTMKSILKNERNYGCSTLEVLSECIGPSCKLYKK